MSLVVGQSLFKVMKSGEIVELKIDSIARKYFTCAGSDTKYLISTLEYRNAQYSQANFKLRLTKEEIMDEREHSQLWSLIRREFDYMMRPKFTINQLRKVCEILELEKNNDK